MQHENGCEEILTAGGIPFVGWPHIRKIRRKRNCKQPSAAQGDAFIATVKKISNFGLEKFRK